MRPRLEACAGCGRDVWTTVKPPKEPYCNRCIGQESHADTESRKPEWDCDDDDDNDD